MARGSVKPRPSTDGKRMSYRVKWETRGPDGKRQHHSATCRTKKEADALLIEKQKEVNDGTHVVPSTATVSQYLQQWLAASAPGWSEATLVHYRSIIRKRIDPHIGHIPLARLDAITVQAFYAKLTASYAPASVRTTHAVLDNALQRAVRWRLIASNPADNATLPAIPRAAPNVWTAEECTAFLAAVSDHRFAALWRLSLDSGMRLGEVITLSWRDIDLDKGIITVRRTLTRDAKGRGKIGEIPKTRASRRSIVIGQSTIAALRTYRASQSQRRLRLGGQWTDLNLVFDRGDGQLMAPTVVRHSFDRVLKRNPSLPIITPHAMRHTMATLLLIAGVNPKIVQERLGHASIQMTLDRYSHVTITMQENAASIMDALLSHDSRPIRGQELG